AADRGDERDARVAVQRATRAGDVGEVQGPVEMTGRGALLRRQRDPKRRGTAGSGLGRWSGGASGRGARLRGGRGGGCRGPGGGGGCRGSPAGGGYASAGRSQYRDTHGGNPG